MGLRESLKEKVGSVVHQSGAVRLVQKLNQKGVRILMYHRFPRQDAANFDRQCRYLAGNYEVVPLAEAVDRLKHGAATEDLAVITADDGYADMHDVAFPILRRYRLPATLFVTSGFIDRSCWMPGDRVRYHFSQTGEESVRVKDDAELEHVFRTDDPRGPDGLRALLKRVPHATRLRILAGLRGGEAPSEAVASQEEFRPCTWSQLREMADAGISIGAHTVTHAVLSRLSTGEEKRREILDSKTRIERELQREVDLFAYPNGLPRDVDDVSVECVRGNFRGAVMASFGLNAPGADVFQLRRLGCEPGMPVAVVARMLAGPLRRSGAPAAIAERK